MKLAQKYNRVNLITSLIILVLSGAIYYLAIHYILTNKLDNDLKIEEEEIIASVHKYKKLPLPSDFKDQKVTYEELKNKEPAERSFSNTSYYNPEEKEIEPGRSLLTNVRIGKQDYKVTITKSSLEAEDLVRLIFLITLGVIAILLISLTIVNRFILSSLWRPFYETLKQLKAFNLADKNEFSVQYTQIDEFQELNQSVISMSDRVRQDYKELKSFTDNASHEMMTPLAVINAKLDTLIQTEALSDQQGELIEDVYLAVNKLSRLNQSLLLLAKIENNLIKDEEDIALDILIAQKIRQFKELFTAGDIRIEQHLDNQHLLMSKYLADILLNNLINNAIRHNVQGGGIKISLLDGMLSIANTGSAKALDGSRAFERFYKDSSSEGTGLGLAITSQICNLYRYKLTYNYETGWHIFTIQF
ncbi:signal transduction histidine kinase [Pedobacter cryoconitis]|uniref:sensor histidine kinase n=1 Tax=Pedobacter cryoconitis TaxID=188932 RepID=UPI0016075847|nr:HAMP domain-containing sensor histidine kinase [Pedobacter cryoconitis]MBB6270943.1 signal transduction histidine kinase [Pedobacter cryoconitis]